MSSSGLSDRSYRIYTPWMLRMYDFQVLEVNNRLLWRCPTAELRRLYDDNVGVAHLDVGVGTGYFLDAARWPSPPQITLVDVNPHPLAAASSRIARYRPAVKCANVLEPLDLPPEAFDSVAANYLLHCLPGRFPAKAVAVLGNLRPHVRPGGVLFGSTILTSGVPVSPVARVALRAFNRVGVFANEHDSLDGLDVGLRELFPAGHTLTTRGMVALFTARV